MKLNGKAFENPYNGHAPNWITHTMLLTGVYDSEGKVKTADGGIYDPSQKAKGITDFNDLEFQFIFFDASGDDTESVPHIFKFACHMFFEDVTVIVKQVGRYHRTR